MAGGFFFVAGEGEGRGEGGEFAGGGELEVGGVAGFGFGDRVEDQRGCRSAGWGRARRPKTATSVPFGVGGVEVAFGVDRDADRAGEVAGAEGAERFAGGVELGDLVAFVDVDVTV